MELIILPTNYANLHTSQWYCLFRFLLQINCLCDDREVFVCSIKASMHCVAVPCRFNILSILLYYCITVRVQFKVQSVEGSSQTSRNNFRYAATHVWLFSIHKIVSKKYFWCWDTKNQHETKPQLFDYNTENLLFGKYLFFIRFGYYNSDFPHSIDNDETQHN